MSAPPWQSLRWRLMSAVGAVALVSLAAVGLFSGWAAREEARKIIFLEEAGVEQLEAELRGAEETLLDALSREPRASPRDVAGRALETWAASAAPDRRHGVLLLIRPDSTRDGPSDGATVASDPELDQLRVELRNDGTVALHDRPPGRDDRGQEMVLQVPIREIPFGPDHPEVDARLIPVPLVPWATPDSGLDRLSAERRFARAVDRRLLVAVAAASVLSLIVTWLVTRRLVGPVDRLVDVARRLEAGERGLRARLDGDDEVARLGHAFDRLSDAFERSEASSRALIASVAHELRTPLTAVRCQLEALEDGLLTFDSARATSLREDVGHLEGLVEDLQDLALADAERLRLDRETVDLHRLVVAAVDEARAFHRTGPGRTEQGAEIHLELEPGIWLDVDPGRVRQIVRNLLTNALRHTPAGGRITISLGEPSAPGENGGSWVELRADDTGPGVAPEHLPHLFERFYRADASRQRATGGAGLGLAIVHQLAVLHGGRARIENRVDPETGRISGARAAVTLPRASGAGP